MASVEPASDGGTPSLRYRGEMVLGRRSCQKVLRLTYNSCSRLTRISTFYLGFTLPMRMLTMSFDCALSSA